MSKYKEIFGKIKRGLKGAKGADAKAWQSYLKEQAKTGNKKEESENLKKVPDRADVKVFLPQRKLQKKKIRKRLATKKKKKKIIRLALMGAATILLCLCLFFTGSFLVKKVKNKAEESRIKTQKIQDLKLYESEDGIE
ncbi:MAG TPA: hypothetical protein VIR32_08030 [Lachnospiraceae bacterium]